MGHCSLRFAQWPFPDYLRNNFSINVLFICWATHTHIHTNQNPPTSSCNKTTTIYTRTKTLFLQITNQPAHRSDGERFAVQAMHNNFVFSLVCLTKAERKRKAYIACISCGKGWTLSRYISCSTVVIYEVGGLQFFELGIIAKYVGRISKAHVICWLVRK